MGELGHLVDKYELASDSEVAVTTNNNFALPESFWAQYERNVPSPSLVDSSKRIRKANHWSTKQLTWSAGDRDRARELVEDLHSFNESLYWASGVKGDTGAFVSFHHKYFLRC